jgi:hypothetical protein
MRTGLVVAALLASACKKDVPPPVVVVQPAPVQVNDDNVVDALTPPARLAPPDLLPPPRANTMNGDPNGPQQAAFEALSADGQKKVQACLEAIPASAQLPPGPISMTVKYEVGNDGKPASVDVTSAAPADTIACAKSAIEGLAFPPYKGSLQRTQFQIAYSRPTTTVAPAKP